MTRPAGLIGIMAMVVSAFGGAQSARALDLYVAPDGRDTWSGRQAASDPARQGVAVASPDKKDGPFATLERARDEIRKLKRDNGLHEPVAVHARAGTYCLDRTFKLTAQDSGTADAPVVYRGHGAERPLLVGGKPVAGFAPHKDNILVADPLFVAPEKDDWRLRPDSPAFKLGFQPIPAEKIGPYQDPLRASWPIVEAAGAREWLAAS